MNTNNSQSQFMYKLRNMPGGLSRQCNCYESQLNPYIEKSKCNSCGKCAFFCPHTKEKLQQEARKVSAINLPHTYGLQNASYYLAWVAEKEKRQKSCSDGAVTRQIFKNSL